MIKRRYRAGDRVRLLKPVSDDWSGTATVTRNQRLSEPDVIFLMDEKGEGRRRGFAYWTELELIAEQPDSEPAP